MARVRLSYQEQVFTFSTTAEVRFADVNIGAHLGFDSFVTLLGEARSKFLEANGIAEVASPGIVVADLAVVYRAQARMRDLLRIDVGVTEPHRFGADIAYRVVRESDSALIGTAKTGVVFIDYDTGSLVAAPSEFTALVRQ